MTALVSPFRDGRVDEQALRGLVDWQITCGVHALVPCGTTGEAPCLTDEEHERVVRIVVEQASGRVPVIAGASSNSTEKAIKLAKQAKWAGADATLQVTPYYNKPTQEGLFAHFQTIATAVDLPMILYNVPGRTSVNLEPATTLRLAKIPNIIGIKEASGKLSQIEAIIKEAPDGFDIFSGDDALNTDIYALGGKGTISVTANIVPQLVAKVWNLWQTAREEALALQEKLQPLNRVLFIETNPIPVKTALAIMGKCREEFRLPMTAMNPQNRSRLEMVLMEIQK